MGRKKFVLKIKGKDFVVPIKVASLVRGGSEDSQQIADQAEWLFDFCPRSTVNLDQRALDKRGELYAAFGKRETAEKRDLSFASMYNLLMVCCLNREYSSLYR